MRNAINNPDLKEKQRYQDAKKRIEVVSKEIVDGDLINASIVIGNGEIPWSWKEFQKEVVLWESIKIIVEQGI